MIRKIRRAVLAIVILALGASFAFYHQVVRPKRLVRKLYEHEEQRSDEELRRFYHAATRWRPDHDSLIGLMEVGDESSIPYLVRNLAQLEGEMVCTKSHCIDALKNITGEDFGEDAEAWQRWAESRP